MIETLIFIAVVIVAAAVVCWAINRLAPAFGQPINSVVPTVLIVLVVLIALLIVLAHLGYVKG